MPSQDILDNRQNVIDAHNPKQGFASGFTGGHALGTLDGINSWITGGFSGLIASKLSSEEDQRKWEIGRKAMEFGVGDIDSILDAYRKQGELENFTDEEAQEIKELMARKETILRDLDYVSRNKDGDLDAPIDTEGQSMNQRWGYGDDEEGGEASFIDLVKVIASNPVHGSGLIAGELVKDLPLAVAASIGLTAKGLKGAELYGKLMNKINGIKPKALRGLAKVAVPVAGGAVGGGVYEASYSALNEGKIKWGDVQTGTEFGAAFGLIAGTGALGKELIKSKVKKPDADTPKSKVVDEDVEDYLDEVLSNEEILEASRWSKSVYDEHNTVLFPELEKVNYDLISYAQAKARDLVGVADRRNKASFATQDADGHHYIVWNEDAAVKTHQKLLNKWSTRRADMEANAYISDATPNMIKYLKDENTFKTFVLAHEKAHLIQNLEGRSYAPHKNDARYKDRGAGTFNKEREANKMAINELDRIFKEHKTKSANASEAVAKAQKKAQDDAEHLMPKDRQKDKEAFAKADVVEEGQRTRRGDGGKVVGAIERNQAKAVVGAGAAAYALSDEEDAPYSAIAAGLAMIGGPKAYRKLTSSSIPQTVAKARVQMSKAQEDWSIYAKQLEVHGQELGDKISELYRGMGENLEFFNFIENPRKYKPTTTADKEIVKQWNDWFKFLGGQGVAVGMFIKAGSDPVRKARNKLIGTQLVANYVPHLIRGKKDKDGTVRPLDNKEREEITAKLADRLGVKIIGSVSNSHQIPRKIHQDTEWLLENGYDVVTDPAEILAIYTQAMARTIHNRKIISEFKDLDLGQGKGQQKVHAILTDKDFNAMVEAKLLTPEEQGNYIQPIHPSLKGHRVHANVSDILDDYFQVSREGGLNDFAEGLLSMNNSLKRVFVFGSLFHSQALLMSGIYSMGLSGALKGLRGKGKINNEHDWSSLDLKSGEFRTLAKDALRDGLQILNIKRQDLVNPGKVELDALLDKLGMAGDISKKAFDGIDKLTWEFMHDRYKLASYLRHKENAMANGMSEVAAGRAAAKFTNDAFGSLDWNNFATRLGNYAYNNPNSLRGKAAEKVAQMLPSNKRRWLNLGLFAPDWTISNLRIIGKTFTDLPEASDAFLNGILRGKNWHKQDAKDILSAYKMYAAYTARAGFYTSAMWWTMTELFSDNEPTMKDLDDFWFGEHSGKLDLGNGRSMVVSKQVAEFIHWFQHPQHSLINKASIVPKTIMEGLLNKQWFSMKKGSPHGPAIIDPTTGESHLGKWVSGKFVPIVIKPMMDDSLDIEDKLSSTISGFFGFPQYQHTSK